MFPYPFCELILAHPEMSPCRLRRDRGERSRFGGESWPTMWMRSIKSVYPLIAL